MDIPQQHQGKSTDLLTWTMREFDSSRSNRRFSLVLMGIFLAVIIYALVMNSPIMAITFVLLGAVTFLHSRREPKTITCSLTTSGVTVDKEFYGFDHLQSFWVIYEPEERSLFLKTNGALVASVRVPLGDTNPSAVRDALLPFAREVKYEPTIIDTFSTFLHI